MPPANMNHAFTQIELALLLRALASPRGLKISGAFNLGKPDDYRVPDLGVLRGSPDELYVSTAAMIVEILSPYDKTFDFYGRQGVEEILVADLEQRSFRLWRYDEPTSSYLESESSRILETTLTELQATISWP